MPRRRPRRPLGPHRAVPLLPRRRPALPQGALRRRRAGIGAGLLCPQALGERRAPLDCLHGQGPGQRPAVHGPPGDRRAGLLGHDDECHRGRPRAGEPPRGARASTRTKPRPGPSRPLNGGQPASRASPPASSGPSCAGCTTTPSASWLPTRSVVPSFEVDFPASAPRHRRDHAKLLSLISALTLLAPTPTRARPRSRSPEPRLATSRPPTTTWPSASLWPGSS